MRNERGVALVVAVLVLTVIGALVAAAFFAGTQEHRMAEAGRRMQQANGAAEFGLAEVVRHWPEDATSLTYPTGRLALPTAAVPGGAGAYTAFVHRLGADLYLVDVLGRDRPDIVRVRLGLFVLAPVPCDSAVVEGLELSQSKCHIDKSFQKTSGPNAFTFAVVDSAGSRQLSRNTKQG